MSGSAVGAALVVIPAHDEADLLDRCLSAVAVAARHAAARGIRCEVRVVLDDCRDDSDVVAGRHPFPVLEIGARRVGAARAAGIEHGLAALAEMDARRIWIANTDADTEVPPNWITAQCAAADEGADVFVGTVRPDFDDLSPEHRRHWLRTHLPGEPNGHVHGASLGLRASAYRAAGGFDDVREHEDVFLVEACRALGATIHASDHAEVVTSGRFVGRTPGGYAGYLRQQAQLLDARDTPATSTG